MAQQDKFIDDDAEATGGRRFRLPKLFAGSDEADTPEAAARKVAERANALGVTLPPAIVNAELIQQSNNSFDGQPRASVIRVSDSASGQTSEFDEVQVTSSISSSYAGDTVSDSEYARDEDMQRSEGQLSGIEAGLLLDEIGQLREGMEEMYRTLNDLFERGQAQDKVFNTLHSELQDYKNDFIYEHLKPVVRPLLFLFDSMEHFDEEMSLHKRAGGVGQGIAPEVVRENVSFFRDQLVEALRICEVTLMQKPEGQLDPRLHKAVQVVETNDDQDNMIQRVVRSGWYLNGRVFRHAEVVVGKNTKKL